MTNNNYLIRIITLITYILGLVVIFEFLNHSILNASNVDLILFSSLSILAINLLVVEHFFETPKDVIGASLNGLILLLSLFHEQSFSRSLFNFLLVWFSSSLLLSIASVIFYQLHRLALANHIKGLAVKIGKSKVCFSLLITFVLIEFYKEEDFAFYVFTISYFIILSSSEIRGFIFNVINFLMSLFRAKQENINTPVGVMTAVQSKNTFIIDLIDSKKREALSLFGFIEFKSELKDKEIIVRGFIIDRYQLDDKQKIKVLKVGSIDISQKKDSYKVYEKNIVYKATPSPEEKLKLENFVGTIIDKSDISEIRFEYSPNNFLTNGDLLELQAQNKKNEMVDVLYQVTEAMTEIKNLEDNNETGLIISKANHLGVWQSESRSFENYGWVPQINTGVYRVKEINGPELQAGEIELGSIESTNFKVLANVKKLVTMHTAILGATGQGKSVFARDIINKITKHNTKVFCVDLTGEIKKFIKVKSLGNYSGTVSFKGVDTKFEDIIKYITDNRGSAYGKDPKGLDEYVKKAEELIKVKINEFMTSPDSPVGVLELPELSNTEETLEYTKLFFKALFDLAKDGLFSSNQACIVLEEAHTLIPEWNSVGGADDKVARRVTNTIAQIALQGRKYNVGLFIIAQRTANVSKTILTQCNTVISFKQFDNTSRDFLSNHFGSNFVSSLPILKKRRALISGEALVSDVPIIFKVPEIKEEEVENSTAVAQDKTKGS